MNTPNLLKCIALAAICTLVACKGSKEKSSATGWNYNDKTNGGVLKAPYIPQATGPGLVLIEGGTFAMGKTEEDLLYTRDNPSRRVTVASFYIDETETTNQHYRDYIAWMKKVFAENHREVVDKALPDTLVWREKLAYNEPYVENYFRNPAYMDYPVVGINWLQANDYCIWRTDRVNEQRMIDRGVLKNDLAQKNENNFNTDAYYANQYEGAPGKTKLPTLDGDGKGNKGPGRKAQMEDGIMLPKYRLPTEAEWEYAAVGLLGNSKDENVFRRRVYPWNGHVIRSPDKKFRGVIMDNLKRGRGDNMGVAGKLNDKADITAPVGSYFPNDYGLYNMAGNVAEWVLDVYRPMSHEDVEDFNPYRGNEFKKAKRNPDGSLVQKDEFGKIQYVNVDTADNKNRRNYKVADNRDYADGDRLSSSSYDKPAVSNEKMMYESTGGKPTTLISNKSRVYKGGSWKDRAYYMSPGVRRFLDEDIATNYIGFRCAMVRIGAIEGGKSKKSKK